jgi:hypothetical protein
MPDQPLYVPILKGKEGEFAALEALDNGVKSRLAPLIEVPAVPYDYTNERPAKSLDEHVASVPDRLKRCCGDIQFYLDLPWFDADEHLSDGRTALEAILTACNELEIVAIPVLSRASSRDYLSAAIPNASRNIQSVCIRLLVEDFDEQIDLDAEIDRLMSSLGLSDGSTADLVIDLEDLTTDSGRATLIARSVLSMIPRREEWRRIILAASSFPEDLSDVGAATTTTLPRLEWDLWRTLQRRPGLLPRQDLIFGDYAIAHPIPKELDPRTMRMSANIRYTTENEWLVIKGRNVRQYGFDQYFDLCQILVEHPDYSGRDFSWGDGYIEECAQGLSGPGNATTWRKVGVNHHLTLVARELAKLHPGS